MTLVASSRPPRPTSSSNTSAGLRANSSSPAAVVISNTGEGAPALDALPCAAAVGGPPAETAPPFARGAEPKALVEAHEMRRGIDVHAHARRLQDRAHERDGRALAVGAADVDRRRQPPLGM